MNPILDSTPKADEALQHMKAGNERFVAGTPQFLTVQKEILTDLAKGPASLRHHVELQRLASAARVGFRRRFWRAVYCPRRGQCAITGGRWQPAIRRPAFAHSAFFRARLYKLRRCRRSDRHAPARHTTAFAGSGPRRFHPPKPSPISTRSCPRRRCSRKPSRPTSAGACGRLVKRSKAGSARPKGV
jgi:hypothetical protein